MRISDWSSDVCSSDLAQPQPRVGAEGEADAVVSPFEDDATPEKRAAVRAFADALPAKRVHVDNNWLQEAMEADIKRHGNRGLGGWQCTCGRFAKFVRWQHTGDPGYERGYRVNCNRCERKSVGGGTR